jgi:hypothetical protein
MFNDVFGYPHAELPREGVENFQHARPHISRIGWKRCLFCQPFTANIFDPPQLADLAKATSHAPVRAG